MNKIQELTQQMICYYGGTPNYIQHFLKVHRFAQIIGLEEGLDAHTQFVLEAAALIHDIGIKPAEEKYGNHCGKYQEEEGPAPARKMLSGLGFTSDDIERICYLIAHHHTYTNVDGIDYRILLEADFLVNLYEEGTSTAAVEGALENIFQTDTGTKICKTMFGI